MRFGGSMKAFPNNNITEKLKWPAKQTTPHPTKTRKCGVSGVYNGWDS
jgi:hypothetical protein